MEWNGTEGTIILNDEGWEIRTERKQANVDSQKKPGSGDPRPAHVRNFLDCVKSRKMPNSDVEIGRLSTTLCHLANISYKLQRDVRFDPETETFGEDRAANALLTKQYRAPYVLPAV